MRPVPAVAATQFGAFTTSQAVQDGWTSHALRHAVRVDALTRLRPGVYARPLDDATPAARVDALRTRAAAVSLANRGVVVASAAVSAMNGIALLRTPDDVWALFPRGRSGAMAGVHRHRGRMRPGHVVAHGPVLLTSPARTVVDIAREFGLAAGLVAVDAASRAGQTDERAHPAPEPQVAIRALDGRFLGRVDFYWEQFGVVGAADDAVKYDDADDEHMPLRLQNIRQDELEDTGLIVVRWGWRDLWTFDPTARRIGRACARGSRPDRAPRRWLAESTTWPQTSAAGRA